MSEAPRRSQSALARGAFVPPSNGRGGPALSNLGGRFLVSSEMRRHKERMKQIQPKVDLSPPWAHQQGNRPTSSGGKAAAKLRAKVARPDTAPTQSRPPTAGRPGSAAGFTAAGVPPPDAFDVLTLSEADQETYRSMLCLLCRLDNQSSRAALEQLYRDSEDRKLLVSYTGVFPTLADAADL